MRLPLSIAIAVLPLVTFGQIPFSLQDRAFITSTSPLRKDLAGYWRLEEASGTRYDFSKNGNHLTSNNSVGQGAGVSTYTANAATFAAASNQYLSIASNSALQAAGSFTLAAWCSLTSTNAERPIIAKWLASAGAREYLLLCQGGQVRFLLRNSADTTSTTVIASTFGNVPLNTWFLAIAWYDSVAQTINISINNGTVDSIAHTGGTLNTGTEFRIGSYSTAMFDGSIDEPMISKRVLTAANRTQLYNAGLGTHFPWAHP